MNSYLDIAQTVLRMTRRPMNSREILSFAYKNELVPYHLYGTTQHKTLGARLSEDILKFKKESAFFRNAPGKFFLAEFLHDSTIPAQYRKRVSTRRRTRDLFVEPVLVAKCEITEGFSLLDADAKGSLTFKKRPNKAGHSIVWVFSIVQRGEEILSYRNGRFREATDDFLNKKSVGFRSPIYLRHQDLFSTDDIGIANSAVESVSYELDIHLSNEVNAGSVQPPKVLCHRILKAEKSNTNEYVVVVRVFCPQWFDLTTKRLSLNNPKWVSVHNSPNHVEGFDAWSEQVLDVAFNVSGSQPDIC